MGRMDALERRLEPGGGAFARRIGRKLVVGLVASLVVWAVAAPLVALRFHLVSPIGILLNLPLIPIPTPTLRGCGSAYRSRGRRSRGRIKSSSISLK